MEQRKKKNNMYFYLLILFILLIGYYYYSKSQTSNIISLNTNRIYKKVLNTELKPIIKQTG